MLLQRLIGRAAAILIVCLFGTNVSYVAALPPHTPGTSQLGGWVYIDRNNDGEINFAKIIIALLPARQSSATKNLPILRHGSAGSRQGGPWYWTLRGNWGGSVGLRVHVANAVLKF